MLLVVGRVRSEGHRDRRLKDVLSLARLFPQLPFIIMGPRDPSRPVQVKRFYMHQTNSSHTTLVPLLLLLLLQSEMRPCC